MRLRYQRLLYSFFFLLFFLVAPALILYATGYRYDIKKNLFRSTGVLVITSAPREATVTLNDKEAGVTPLRLNRLLPADYSVAISRDGYHAWRKDVTIKSRLTSFLNNIQLFKIAEPQQLDLGTIDFASISPDAATILIGTTKPAGYELTLVDQATKNQSVVATLPSATFDAIEPLDWSASGNQLLVHATLGDFNMYYLIDRNAKTMRQLIDITRLNFDSVRWHNRNDYILFGLRKDTLYQIDTATQQTIALLSAPITDVIANNNRLYISTFSDNQPALSYIELNRSNHDLSAPIQLPGTQPYQFVSGPPQVITLIATQTQHLLVINAKWDQLTPTPLLDTTATHAAWSANNHRLAFWNDFELSYFDLATRTTILLGRYSNPIADATWHPSSQYILYTNTSEVRAVEAIAAVYKHDIILTAMENVTKIKTDPLGSILLFTPQTEDAVRVYFLPLK